MKKILLPLFALALLFTQQVEGKVKGALIQTEIHASPLQDTQTAPNKIQPGTRMKLEALVRNVGDMANAPGTIHLRFALPKPLDKQKNSVLFETETVELPSIPPGQQVTISFKTPHQWPSLFDFIRNDWAMREYEAVVSIGDKAEVTGTRVISFSAYYYEGPSEQKAVKVSSN